MASPPTRPAFLPLSYHWKSAQRPGKIPYLLHPSWQALRNALPAVVAAAADRVFSSVGCLCLDFGLLEAPHDEAAVLPGSAPLLVQHPIPVAATRPQLWRFLEEGSGGISEFSPAGSPQYAHAAYPYDPDELLRRIRCVAWEIAVVMLALFALLFREGLNRASYPP